MRRYRRRLLIALMSLEGLSQWHCDRGLPPTLRYLHRKWERSDRFRLHLRHEQTLFARRLADIAKVQERLGHANIATTHIYDHRWMPPEGQPNIQGQLLKRWQTST